MNAYEPFAEGGAEYLADGLLTALRDEGHHADLLQIPFSDPGKGRLLDRMKACSLLSLHNPSQTHVDLVIGLKFPAYLIQHPNKILWIIHQYRQAYELWDRKIGHLANEDNGSEMRKAVIASDNAVLNDATAVHALSKNVAGRLRKYNEFTASHLYCPPPLADRFSCAPAKDYILCLSRPDPLKRQILVLEALVHTQADVRVIFAGGFKNDRYFRFLQKQAAELGVDDRVVWAANISEQEKLDLYAGALGVVFAPIDEDYGFVTLEAMLSGKPVLTSSDSGGVLEFVAPDETGLVVAPTAQGIADGLDRLWGDRESARQMGKAGRDLYHQLDISWSNVVQRLTATS